MVLVVMMVEVVEDVMEVEDVVVEVVEDVMVV